MNTKTKTVVTPLIAAARPALIVHGTVEEFAIKKIVQVVFGALPVNLHKLQQDLQSIEAVDYEPVIFEGTIAKGRDTELAYMMRGLLYGAYGRLAYALGKEAQELASEVTHVKGKTFETSVGNNSLITALGLNEEDNDYDGFTFESDTYVPTREEAIYDIETLGVAGKSLSAHEGCAYVINSFKTSDGSIIHMFPSWDMVRKDTLKREQELVEQLAQDEKDLAAGLIAELPQRRTEIGPIKLAGYREECDMSGYGIGVNEAFENVERLLGLVGFDDEIGRAAANTAGRKVATKLVYGLYDRRWKDVRSAFLKLAFIGQSPDGMSLLTQLIESPEWDAAQYAKEDAAMKRMEEKAKRLADSEDRKTAIDRDKDVRAMRRKMDEIARTKADLEHKKIMAALQKEANELAGIKAPVAKKAQRKTRKATK